MSTSKEKTDVKASRRIALGPLHDLLLLACPRTGYPKCSIRASLAPALGVSHQYIYNWIAAGRIPANKVLKIVEVSEGRVSQEDLIPYVIS